MWRHSQLAMLLMLAQVGASQAQQPNDEVQKMREGPGGGHGGMLPGLDLEVKDFGAPPPTHPPSCPFCEGPSDTRPTGRAVTVGT